MFYHAPISRGVLALVFAFAALTKVGAAVDFAPVPTEYSSEGFTYTRLTLKTDTSRITLNPPPKWAYRGSGNRLQLTPPDAKFAEGSIEALVPYQPEPITPALVEIFTKHALTSVPPSSQAVEIVKQEENSLPFNGSPSYEIGVSYQALGETFQRSVIVVNASDMQLVFRFTARKADFETLYSAFRRCLGTWQVQPMAVPES